MPTRSCPFCASEIDASLAACPYCNENLLRHRPAPAASAPPPQTQPCPYCAEPVQPYAEVCRWCNARLRGAGPGTAYAPARQYIEWDDKNRNVFARWWSTWAGTQFGMDGFWGRVPWEGGHRSPLTFLLFLWAQMLMLFAACGIPFFLLMFASAAASPRGGAEVGIGVGAMLVFVMVGIPIWLLLAVGMTYVMAAIHHVCLSMLGGQGSYEATFRAFCYSSGSGVWGLIPYVGGLVQLVFHLICLTHGFAYAHRISKGRAFVAAILPALVCIGIGVAVAFVIIASAAASGSMR